MHLIRGLDNPGMPVGNPVHALHDVLTQPPSHVMQKRGGSIGPPQISYDDTFDDDSLENLLHSPSIQDAAPPSSTTSDQADLPPSHPPFEPRPLTDDLNVWLNNLPDFEDF